MKRILQALDGASTKPVQGASDMSKFLSIIDKNDVSIIKEEINNNKVLNEGANPHKVSLPVQMAMQHYQTPTKRFVAEKTIKTSINKFFREVEEEQLEEQENKQQLIRQYASTIAERVMMKESKKNYNFAGEKVGQKAGELGQLRGNAKPRKDGKQPAQNKLVGGMEEAQSLGSALSNALSKVEPGSKLDKKIKHHNDMVRRFGKEAGTMTSAPDGYHIDKKGHVRLGQGVNEEEIHSHSMGFTGGVGPGLQSNQPVEEAPLDFNKDEPMGSEIHSHQGVNPASIQSRIMRARRQFHELAKLAESDDPGVWAHISRLFPELAMNVEQVRHGVEELAKIRKMGGRRTANIPASVAEGKSKKQEIPSSKPRNFVAKNAMATTSGAGAHTDKKKAEKQGYEKHKNKSYDDVMEEISKIKPIKAKKKTSTCRTGQVQTGTQVKDGKVVPKCTVRQTAK